MKAQGLSQGSQWSWSKGALLWPLLAVLAMVLMVAAPAAHSPAAEAAAGEVAVFDNSDDDGGTGVTELSAAISAAGKTAVVISPAAWTAMTTADFAAYDAIALPDPRCGSESAIAEAVANAATWGAAVDGNVLVIGTDEVFHSSGGRGSQLMASGAAFAVAQAGKTGAYISLSCYYGGDEGETTPLPWLGNAFGGTWEASGVGCFNDSHLVATHPALAGLTDALLSNWSCSVHEAFTEWPINFEVLAIAEGIGTDVFTAPDGTQGTPYIVARGVEVISDIDLTPAEATNPVGTSHTLTALVEQDDGPVEGVTVTFTVIDGPHAGVTGTGVTNDDGNATFSYTGTTVGDDTIEATFVDDRERTQRSNRVIKHWIEGEDEPAKAVVTTQIHFTDHTPLPCYAPDCGGQLAPANSVVHDEVTVTNNSASKTPTGRVVIAFWVGTRHCTGKPPASVQFVTLAGSGAVTTAESSNSVALAPGDYSYRAIYFPDGAAKEAGFITTPSFCEQLRVLPPAEEVPSGPDSPQP